MPNKIVESGEESALSLYEHHFLLLSLYAHALVSPRLYEHHFLLFRFLDYCSLLPFISYSLNGSLTI